MTRNRSDYPTTDDVKNAYCTRWGYAPIASGEFDRWLADMKAATLEAAADAWLHGAWGDTPRRRDRIADRMAASQFAGDWLRTRAAAIRLSPDAGPHD